MDRSARFERALRQILDAVRINPRRILHLVIWVLVVGAATNAAERQRVIEILTFHVDFNVPFGLTVGAESVTLPITVFILKFLGGYVVAAVIVVLAEVATLQLMADQPFAEQFREEIDTIKRFGGVLTDTMQIREVFGPESNVPATKRRYALAVLESIEDHVSKGGSTPIKVLTMTGKHFLGTREYSLLWHALERTRVPVEVILVDPDDTEALKDRLRVQELGPEPTEDSVEAYKSEILDTINAIHSLHQKNDAIRAFKLALPVCMHLVVFRAEVYCVMLERGSRVEQSPWYRFAIPDHGFSFGYGLSRVFDTLRKAAEPIPFE